ncbi:MAG: hypothetical protein ACFFC7_01300 [Candidatus Hermodarchaeota archaeon]
MKTAEAVISSSDKIEEALRSFQGFQISILRWVVWTVPWIIFLAIIFTTKDLMYISAFFIGALTTSIGQILIQYIPKSLHQIWSIIKSPEYSDDYLAFVQEFEKRLNWFGGQLIGSITGLIIGLTRILYEIVGLGFFPWSPWGVWGLALEPLFGILLGLIGWRMFVTAIQIWKLGKKSYLTPQPGHPDKCGGFASLGYLCTFNGLIVLIWAILLGFWIFMGSVISIYEDYYTPFFILLLPLLAILAFVTFILPLWKVHETMDETSKNVTDYLFQLDQKMKLLTDDLRDQIDILEEDNSEIETKFEKLNKMNQIWQIYQQRQYPKWPFKASISRFWVLAELVLSLMSLSSLLFNI